MKHITRIEDLPPEMQKRARWCLLVYGNVFIYNSDDGPVLLHPDKMSMLMHKPPEKTYGTPLLMPEDEIKKHAWDQDILTRLDLDGARFENYVTGKVVDGRGHEKGSGEEDA